MQTEKSNSSNGGFFSKIASIVQGNQSKEKTIEQQDKEWLKKIGKENHKFDDFYQGQKRDGQRFGLGRLFDFDWNLVYEGEWEYNVKQGHGKSFYPQRIVQYDGQWKQGLYHGKGNLYHENGKLHYSGDWNLGKKHGEGQEFNENGQLAYDGNWKDDTHEGPAKTFYPNGNIKFEGVFANNLEEGHGQLYYDDASKKLEYDGEWVAGKRSGHGKKYHKNGELAYEGDWKNGKYEGEGKQYYYSGNLEYEGSFKDGKQNGAGKLYYSTGKLKLQGEWRMGKKIRLGKEYNKDGILVREVEFEDDKIVFEAGWTTYHPNGQIEHQVKPQIEGSKLSEGCSYDEEGNLVYEGQFQGVYKNGRGKYYNKQKQVVFEGSVLKDEQKAGVLYEYDVWSGDLVMKAEKNMEGENHGLCVWYKNKEEIENCEFVKGVRHGKAWEKNGMGKIVKFKYNNGKKENCNIF